MERTPESSPVDTGPLSMILSGMVDAAVNGGTKKYIEAFLGPDFLKDNPDQVCFQACVVVMWQQLSLLCIVNNTYVAILCPSIGPIQKSAQLQRQLKDTLKEQNGMIRRGLDVFISRDTAMKGLADHLQSTLTLAAALFCRYCIADFACTLICHRAIYYHGGNDSAIAVVNNAHKRIAYPINVKTLFFWGGGLLAGAHVIGDHRERSRVSKCGIFRWHISRRGKQ